MSMAATAASSVPYKRQAKEGTSDTDSLTSILCTYESASGSKREQVSVSFHRKKRVYHPPNRTASKSMSFQHSRGCLYIHRVFLFLRIVKKNLYSTLIAIIYNLLLAVVPSHSPPLSSMFIEMVKRHSRALQLASLPLR